MAGCDCWQKEKRLSRRLGCSYGAVRSKAANCDVGNCSDDSSFNALLLYGRSGLSLSEFTGKISSNLSQRRYALYTSTKSVSKAQAYFVYFCRNWEGYSSEEVPD